MFGDLDQSNFSSLSNQPGVLNNWVDLDFLTPVGGLCCLVPVRTGCKTVSTCPHSLKWHHN